MRTDVCLRWRTIVSSMTHACTPLLCPLAPLQYCLLFYLYFSKVLSPKRGQLSESSLPHLSVLVGSRNITTFLKCLNRQSPPACHWFFLLYFIGHFCCVEHYCPFLFLKLLFPSLSRRWTFLALLIPPWPGLKDSRFSVHHLKIPFLAPLHMLL